MGEELDRWYSYVGEKLTCYPLVAFSFSEG